MALQRSTDFEMSLAAVKSFLEPVISAVKTQSQETPVQTLSKVLITANDVDPFQASKQVLLNACSHLRALHRAAEDQENANPGQVPMIDTDMIATVHQLLDIIVIEGLYPSLGPNVGPQAERKRTSSLYKRVSRPLPDLKLLDEIAFQTILPIVLDPDSTIGRLVRDRHLIDMIATNMDVAFSPDRGRIGTTDVVETLHGLLNRTSVKTLYTLLTTLLRPNAPSWFKSTLSENLSLLPLRPNGVKWAMELVALSHVTSDANPKSVITYETLQHITKVLCSVPSSMSQTTYMTRLAPQLLDLLDDTTNAELSQVAAFVITNGILSKKATGSPGSVGWNLYVKPIHELFGPDQKPAILATVKHSYNTITSQQKLQVVLRRLSAFVLSSPSPAITGRLIRPILLPLWALYNFDVSRVSSSDWNKMAQSLIQIFLKRCGTKEHILLLSSSLLFDGPHRWMFAPGSEGGVEIRMRPSMNGDPDVYQLISKIGNRVAALLDILAGDAVDSNIIGELLMHLMTNSTSPDSVSTPQSQNILDDPEHDPIQELIRLQLIQRIIQLSGDKLKLSPDQMLQFVTTILEDDLESRSKLLSSSRSASKVRMAELSSITGQNQHTNLPLTESDGYLATAISLLNVLISSHKADLTRNPLSKCALLHLEALQSRYADYLSPSTLSSIDSAITMLRNVVDQLANETERPTETLQQLDRDMLGQITKDLASDQAPIRTASIKALQRFIHLKIITIDIPTISLVLVNQIRTDTDEFVFLAAIAALSSLAVVRDPIFVTRATAEAFQDKQEATDVDGRLRVGEALVTLVHAIANADRNSTVVDTPEFNDMLRGVAQTLINVASRRGNRTRESKDRDKAKRMARIQKRRAEKEWGGEVPDFTSIGMDDEDETIGDKERAWMQKEVELSQDMLSTWQNTGLDEDIRIRTSALSILGSILETVPSIFTAELLRSSVMIAQAILQFELGAGKAILRRAAVLIFMGHLKTVVAGEHGTANNAQLDGMQWLEIESLLRTVVDSDDDDLTKGHAAAVIEGLEAWRFQKVREVADGPVKNETIEELKGLSIAPNTMPRTRSKIQELD